MDMSPLQHIMSEGLPVRSATANSASTTRDHLVPPIEADDTSDLDICLLSYRSDPYCGGQGVYIKYLSRSLSNLGHRVTVISGKPYPDLPEEVGLVRLPGENIVDKQDRFSQFELSYLRDPVNLFEWISAVTGGFPDPYTFGKRVVSYFDEHNPGFDIVHDNQSLCYDLTELQERGYPVVATIHHPITVDRDVDLQNLDSLQAKLFSRRWYRFLRMQKKAVQDLDHILTVSKSAKSKAMSDFDVDPAKMSVVYNGIDTDLFESQPVEHQSFRIMTTVSADVSVKGARHLLESFDTVRESINADLIVVGEYSEGGQCDQLITELGLREHINTYKEITYDRMVELYGTADVAVVPSIYEGFGFPAGEAMACGVPVVATTGGALPEVVGDAGVLVEPADSDALADALLTLAKDAELRQELGCRGRERIEDNFDWEKTARETVNMYRKVIGSKGTD